MPTIDLSFDLAGTTIPVDHGYGLFSALSRVVPPLHGDRGVGVHPIRGRYAEPGLLALEAGSRLRLRLPSEGLAPYLALGGSELDLDGHRVRVGIPRVEPLVPAARLAARLVTIRGMVEPAAFEASVRRHLAGLGVAGEPALVPTADGARRGEPKRRVLRIKGKRVVGFALRLAGLNAEESLLVLEKGLGGRRRMGCGVFVPARW